MRIIVGLVLVAFSWNGYAQNSSSCLVNPFDYAAVPRLLPDPTYVSPYDKVEHRASSALGAEGMQEQLTSAASDAAFTRRTVGRWSNQLAAAESKFWGQFDQTGIADEALAKEYAYWLHKREVWSYIRTSINITIGAGVAGLLFDGFEAPEVLSSQSPTISGSPAAYLDNGRYRQYFAMLSYYGFLEKSACSPKYDVTDRGWLLYTLMAPFNVSPQLLLEADQLHAVMTERNETYADVREFVYRRGLVIRNSSTRGFIQEYIEGASADDQMIATLAKRFDPARSYSLRSLYMKPEGEYSGVILNYSAWRGGKSRLGASIPLRAFTGSEMFGCFDPNKIELIEQLVAKYGDRFIQQFSGVSMYSTVLRNAAQDAVVVSCVDPKGVDSDDVNRVMAALGFPLR